MQSIIKSANALIGFFRAAEAVIDAHEVMQDPDLTTTQKAHRIATDCLVFGAQTAYMIGNYHGNWSVNARLAVNAAVGVADVSQRLSFIACQEKVQLDDVVDLGYACTFRVSSFMEDAIELRPNLFGNNHSQARYVADGFSLACAGVLFTKTIAVPLVQFLLSRPEAVDMAIVFYEEDNRPPELRLGSEWESNLRRLRSTNSIDEFNAVPELLECDSVLTQFKCKLNGDKPIRYVLVVKETRNTSTPVYYERDQILKHLTENPLVRPLAWPVEIEWNQDQLEEDLAIQRIINNRLKALLEDFKQVSQEILPTREEIIHNLAKTLGMDQRKKCDAKISKDLMTKTSPEAINYINNISINSIKHSFGSNEKPMPTRVITLMNHPLWKSPDKPSKKDHFHACCSLLGSGRDEDNRALVKVVSIYKKFEIYLSQDLEKYQVKAVERSVYDTF